MCRSWIWLQHPQSIWYQGSVAPLITVNLSQGMLVAHYNVEYHVVIVNLRDIGEAAVRLARATVEQHSALYRIFQSAQSRSSLRSSHALD
jgi:hypothetical protein